MSEKDLLPSDSDESDVDFVPDNEKHESLSEESGSSGKEESDGETKRKKGKKSRKRRKIEKEPEEEPVEKKKDINVDALWAEFKEDVNKKDVTAKSSTTSGGDKEDVKTEIKKIELNECNVKKPVSSVLGKSFPSSVNNKSAPKKGIASVLDKINKKDKLSTLEKSKLDWNKFKQSEGIDEEIKTFNRGKDGYLEKQDFLQRTDLRQFEIEKQLRATKRTFR